MRRHTRAISVVIADYARMDAVEMPVISVDEFPASFKEVLTDADRKYQHSRKHLQRRKIQSWQSTSCSSQAILGVVRRP